MHFLFVMHSVLHLGLGLGIKTGQVRLPREYERSYNRPLTDCEGGGGVLNIKNDLYYVV